jgi:Bacteriophage Lambda NinG protein
MERIKKLNKKPKEVKCKNCDNTFIQRNSFHVSCSIECAIEISREKEAIKKLKAARVEAKIWHDKNDKISLFENKLQSEINGIVRDIDFGTPCIATNSFKGKVNAGHYISRGANQTIRYNLHNIHVQSEHSNTWKSGDTIRYQKGIKKRYGKEYLEFMDRLQETPPIKLSRDELFKLIEKARGIRKSLEKNLIERTPEQRIQLRNEINNELNIYKSEFNL